MEEKFDGTRLSVNLDGGVCAGYNRLGGFIPVPVEAEKTVRALGCGNIWLDGEFEHGQFVAYDLLQFEGKDYRERAQSYRRQQLERLIVDGPFMRLSKEYLGSADKTDALAMFRKRGIEGVVFKHRRSPYMPGKQGVNRKLKFWEDCTVRVSQKMKNDSAHSLGLKFWMEVSGRVSETSHAKDRCRSWERTAKSNTCTSGLAAACPSPRTGVPGRT